jgi:hypothetical protein
MLNVLIQICQKLGVSYDEINSYSSDCDKSKYLLNQISNFIG